MRDLNDLLFFASVVDKGGFAAAERALGVPKSRLSRRVAHLEQELGVRLLQRTTRRLALTEVGRVYYRHCQAMLDEAQAAQRAVEQVVALPRGPLRVSCPVPIAQNDLALLLPKFLAAYPEVRLELLVSNRRIDLVEEGVDVALRVRVPGQEDEQLATRRFRRSCTMLIAAPHCLDNHAAIVTPEDLQNVPVVGMPGADWKLHWPLTHKEHGVRALTLTPRLAADDFTVLREAVLGGMGVGLMPLAYCHAELSSGQVVQVLPDWQSPAGQLHAVYPSRRGLLPAVRAFLDFLAEHLSAEPDGACEARQSSASAFDQTKEAA